MSGIAYQAESWSNLFAAETSASAALTGLLFVSLSINLQQIVKSPALRARAGKALGTLTAVLLMSTPCLIPGQPAATLGIEIGIAGVGIWVIASFQQHRAAHRNPHIKPVAHGVDIALTQASVVPMLAAAASLILGRGGGLYWLVAGTLTSFLTALVDAWVLLIEIQR